MLLVVLVNNWLNDMSQEHAAAAAADSKALVFTSFVAQMTRESTCTPDTQ